MRPLQSLLDVAFDLMYYANQQYSTVMDMELDDIDRLHARLVKTKKKELEALQSKQREEWR